MVYAVINRLLQAVGECPNNIFFQHSGWEPLQDKNDWMVQRIRNRVAKHVGYAILNADLIRTVGVKPVRAEKLSF